MGHLRTRALRPRSGFDPTTGRLHVVIPIRERGAARVSELALPQELKDAGAEAPALRLHEGQPFDLDAYIADRDAIAAWYRNAGWMEARVRGVLEPAGDDLRVRLEVAPGPRLRAGEIRIESRGRSKPGMIRRAVVVEPGALIRPQELSESRARLSELGVFRSVDVRPVPLQEIGRERKAAACAGGRAPPRGGRHARRRRADAAGGRRAAAAVRATDRREGVSDIVVSYVERPDVTLEYGLRYSTLGFRRSRRRALLARQRTAADRRRPRAREPARLGLAPPPLRSADHRSTHVRDRPRVGDALRPARPHAAARVRRRRQSRRPSPRSRAGSAASASSRRGHSSRTRPPSAATTGCACSGATRTRGSSTSTAPASRRASPASAAT